MSLMCVCGEPMRWNGRERRSLMGYGSPPGHAHDDNCVTREYACLQCSYVRVVSRRQRCPAPGCGWVGKAECFCHVGNKVDEWPEEEEIS